MQRPWLAIAAIFLLGALTGALGLFALLGAVFWLRQRPGLSTMCLILAAGSALATLEDQWTADAPGRPSLPAEGEVIDCVQRGARFRVRVRLDAAPDHWVDARLDHRPAGLAAGARVRLTGRLRGLDPADNPGGFDAQSYGRQHRVLWRHIGAMHLRASAGRVSRWVATARDAARAVLKRTAHPRGAGILTGLLLGDRAAVPEDVQRGLAAAGMGHLLAVSGLHVGGVGAMLALIIGRIGRRMRWRFIDLTVFGVAAPLTLAFVALAGFPLSACRAAVMIALYLLGRAIGRPPDALNLLGLAAIWAVATRPSIMHTPAFQLSFGAVLGLICLVPRAQGRWVGAAAVALVAALVTAPIQAAHFGTWAPIGAWANLALLPFALLLVPFGLLALVIAPIWAMPLNWAAAGAEMLGEFAISISELSGLQHVGTHGAWWLAIGAVALVAWRSGAWRSGAWPICLGAALACGVMAIVRHPPGAIVDVIAIGQGDALLIRDAGRAILVDTGPPESASRLLGVLRRAGVGSLDAVIISHGHPDHDGGLAGLVETVHIGVVLTNGRARAGQGWRQRTADLAAHGTHIRAATATQLRVGRLRLDIYPPPADPALSENDASVVIALRGPAASMLLTGDVEADGEALLVANLPRFQLARSNLPVVLKVPHHGSKTSSSDALLDAVRPRAAIFPVGRRNRFGFPHARVQARYDTRQIVTRRTDLDGRVRVHLTAPARIEALRAEPIDLTAPMKGD